MAVKIMIPTPLRAYTDKLDTVEVEGNTAAEVLKNLTQKYVQLQKHLYDEKGNLRSYVNIYINDEDIRYLGNGQTSLKESDVLSIVPSIAGGTVTLVKEIKTKIN